MDIAELFDSATSSEESGLSTEQTSQPTQEPARGHQEAATADEVDDDLDDVPAPAQGQQGTVPLAALHQERAKRRELEQRTAQMQERFNEFMARAAGQQQQQPPQASQPARPEPEIPAFLDDPEGHVRELTRQFQRQLEPLVQFRQQVEQQQAQQVQYQQFVARVAAEENDFKAVTPDYEAATEYLRVRKVAEYQAIGLDPATASSMAARDFQGIASYAMQSGKNPAAVVYGAAKSLGFGGQTAAAPAQGQPRSPNGQFGKIPSSLSSTPGNPAPDEKGEITLEKLSSMSVEDFESFWKDFEKKNSGFRGLR